MRLWVQGFDTKYLISTNNNLTKLAGEFGFKSLTQSGRAELASSPCLWVVPIPRHQLVLLAELEEEVNGRIFKSSGVIFLSHRPLLTTPLTLRPELAPFSTKLRTLWPFNADQSASDPICLTLRRQSTAGCSSLAPFKQWNVEVTTVLWHKMARSCHHMNL